MSIILAIIARDYSCYNCDRIQYIGVFIKTNAVDWRQMRGAKKGIALSKPKCTIKNNNKKDFSIRIAISNLMALAFQI